MRLSNCFRPVFILILIAFLVGYFGFLGGNHQVAGTDYQESKSCSRDSDCESLNREVKLDQNTCVGQANTFEHLVYGSESFFSQSERMAWYLMDKQYTEEIQIGYSIKYDCVNGTCQIAKRVPIVQECTYACLITPTEYKGKTWSNLCVCKPGFKKDKKGEPIIYCGPNGSRYAYYKRFAWTCEEEERIAGICGIGEQCVEKPDEVTCETISGPGPIQYPGDETEYASTSSTITYTFAIPKELTKSIMVVAKQSGLELGRKSISNLSAWE